MHYYNSKGTTTNRWEALSSGEDWNLYFHDDLFEKVDWLKEPREPLQELYKWRAEQIRDQYDKVILLYSGGIDSTNVLETFYYNNIPIDQIISVGAFSQDSEVGSDENHNGEIYHNVYPTIKKLGLESKFHLIDYSKKFENINQFTLINNFGLKFYKHIGSMLSPTHLFWHDFRYELPLMGNIAIVFGTDKPNFGYRDGRGYTFFTDFGLTDYGNFQGGMSYKRVNFYTDPMALDIIRKQVHLIQNFYWDHVPDKMTESDFWAHYNTIVHGLIYKLRNPLPFATSKSNNSILSLRDRFILKDKESDIYKFFRDSIHNIEPAVLDKLKMGRFNFTSRGYYVS